MLALAPLALMIAALLASACADEPRIWFENQRDDTVTVAVDGWLGSPHHRENIEGNFDRTGVGVARARDGTWYYTQIFIARRRFSDPRP